MVAIETFEMLWIVAMILFFVAAGIYAIMEKSITGTLIAVGLACTVWGLLALFT